MAYSVGRSSHSYPVKIRQTSGRKNNNKCCLHPCHRPKCRLMCAHILLLSRCRLRVQKAHHVLILVHPYSACKVRRMATMEVSWTIICRVACEDGCNQKACLETRLRIYHPQTLALLRQPLPYINTIGTRNRSQTYRLSSLLKKVLCLTKSNRKLRNRIHSLLARSLRTRIVVGLCASSCRPR